MSTPEIDRNIDTDAPASSQWLSLPARAAVLPEMRWPPCNPLQVPYSWRLHDGYDAILRSAIATGLVDHVLVVEEMPAKLKEYAAQLVSINGNGKADVIREEIGAHMSKIDTVLRRRCVCDREDPGRIRSARRHRKAALPLSPEVGAANIRGESSSDASPGVY